MRSAYSAEDRILQKIGYFGQKFTFVGEMCQFSCIFGIIIVPLQPKNRDCLYSPARYAREKLRILTAHKTLRFTILGFVVGR